jgi:hypothetical protein
MKAVHGPFTLQVRLRASKIAPGYFVIRSLELLALRAC